MIPGLVEVDDHPELRLHHLNTEPGIFFSEGWTMYNELKWGVKSHRMQFVGNDPSQLSLQANLFMNRKGKIIQPPMNPYLPIWFKPTPTQSTHRQNAQWLQISRSFIDQFCNFSFKGTLSLPPSVTDIRPWQWAGLRTSVRYTCVIDFPYGLHQADKQVRQKINKAQRLGYTCRRTANMEHVYECLRDTEIRQGFTHHLLKEDLELALDLLGEERFRAYVVYSPEGEPVSAEVNLYQEGEYAYGWAAGGKKDYMPHGVSQLLMKYSIDDLQSLGALGIDLCGANIPSVAQSKMSWGARILPYYTIDNFSMKTAMKWTRDWLRYTQR